MLNLNIPPWKLFGWLRKLQLQATCDWQLHHNNMPAHESLLVQSFLAKQITQVTQSLYNQDLVLRKIWLFPTLQSPLKGKRFQTISEIQENTMWQLTMIGKTLRSQGAYFEGDWGYHCPMYNVSCIFNKCFYFSYYTAGYLPDRPHKWNNIVFVFLFLTYFTWHNTL